MQAWLNARISYWWETTLHSYAQIFFSQHRGVALSVLLVTFIEPFLGLCGLLAVLLTNVLAWVLSLPPLLIREGIYGFNALLLGLALGYTFEPRGAFWGVFAAAVLLLLLLTIGIGTLLGQRQLPFLTLPFLVTLWLISLASGSFDGLVLQDQYLYPENYATLASDQWIYRVAHSLDHLAMPSFLQAFFKTLSATFFQQSVLAGLILALTMLWFSRIALSLTLLSFSLAFAAFGFLGMDPEWLTSYLLGSNFIFFGIAIGGFFLVPSMGSYLAVALLTPLLCVFIISLSTVFSIVQLPVYTLPFTALSLLALFAQGQGFGSRYLQRVAIQAYSPEATVYKNNSAIRRLRYEHLARFQLPIWGTWTISQGYDGPVTHLGSWGKALDFVVQDDQERTYRLPGSEVADYYAYDKPVVAPLDGYVYAIADHVEDNEVGGSDTVNNWGNTIVLNHVNGLFSQFSHLRPGSMKVAVGEYVKQGTVLAHVGNSGRSPEPHLHFQIQLSPEIGAQPLAYPFASFLKGGAGNQKLVLFDVPAEGDAVSAIRTAPLLQQSFGWLPGQSLVLLERGKPEQSWQFTRFADAWNRSYLQCERSGAKLWYVYDGTFFYAYDYTGSRHTPLLDFYLAHFRVLCACYRNLVVSDEVPVWDAYQSPFRWLQDLLSPFVRILKADYTQHVLSVDQQEAPKQVTIQSAVQVRFLGRVLSDRRYQSVFEGDKMVEWSLRVGRRARIFHVGSA